MRRAIGVPALACVVSLLGCLSPGATSWEVKACQSKGGVCVRAADAGCEIAPPDCCAGGDPFCSAPAGFTYAKTDPGTCSKAPAGSNFLGCD